MENVLHVSTENLSMPESLFWHFNLASVPVSSLALHMKPCLKHVAEEPSIVFPQIEIKTSEL